MADVVLALLPLLPSAVAIAYLNEAQWLHISLGISAFGYFLTNSLIEVVGEYNKKAGLSGKDLGKKGGPLENRDVPEALGIVSGIVFLMCMIFTQLIFAKDANEMVIYHSALFSICFMIFLGFTDDTLDLKWRYKLILPTIASFPLLSAYSGNTAVYVPDGAIRSLFWSKEADSLTFLGRLIDYLVVVDTEAKGAIIELGGFFLVFMGMLAVFCTNSINIMAGINGLEAGQTYVIACSILFFKLYELTLVESCNGNADPNSHQAFTIVTILPFIGTVLALLKHNWFPAKVFVGDTFCYFAGMTFAVLGIHGHFSKTLLLLFLPQVYNFVISIPQVFKMVPCPRHRLPRVDPETRLLHCSTFPCKSHQFRLIKLFPDAEECPNFTILCTVLRIYGPMKERTLTIVLLGIQVLSTVFAFTLRYIVFEIPVR